MFKVSPNPTFTHEVTVTHPVNDGFSTSKFKATFRVVDVEQLRDSDTLDGQQDLLRKIVVGMDDLVGEDDKPLTYTDELRDQLIAVPYIRAALVQTYLAAVTGARRGN